MHEQTMSSDSGPQTGWPGSGIDCVFLTCFAADFQVFAALLRFSGIRLHRAETIDQADFLLTVTEATVLVSDTLFLDGTWEQAADMIGNVHPRVTLVVVADERDDELHGSSEIVSKPLRMGELRHAIRSAHQEACAEAVWAYAGAL